MEVDRVAMGVRLAAARKQLGTSQRDLAELTGVPQAMVSRLEKGIPTRAPLTTLDTLATTLGIRLDHLLYGSPVRERVLAAARTPAGADVCAALEHAVELLEFDNALDQVVPELRQHRAPAAISVLAAGTPASRGTDLARTVRDHLGLGIAPIPNIPSLMAELTGVDVGSAPLGEASGVCAVDPDRDTAVVLVNSNDVSERQRFSLAHELGHLLFGDGAHVDGIDGRRTDSEVRCDEFARNLLIPQDGMSSWLAQALGITTRDRVDERAVALLVRHFGVSPDVARIQLDRAGLLPATLTAVPSARVLAHRYGWGQQHDLEQELARRPLPPQRLQERATHAYRRGLLGAAAIARLTGRSEADVATSLAEAGVTVEPRTRRADIVSLVARANARA
ncbi:XRE family transcriptional regulator [Frankia sp. Cas3]|uniref:helix-turn-helix domain-containing protein n=1 Tax=Frankia sp. Cas3 TaxID=3073926 RepID=UPI002AD4BF4A|nr:XRE family transcriptional regulator [Frankia sp. Cas3]